MSSVGVIIGRFQVPALTAGHSALLDHVGHIHKRVIVFVGSTPKLSKRNPLPFGMVQDALDDYLESSQKRTSEVMTIPLLDGPSDREWSDRIDQTLATIYPGHDFVLYAGRDSFKGHYIGRWKVIDVPDNGGKSGTEVRDEVLGELNYTEDYRKGLIAAQMMQFDHVYPVVDVAVVKYTLDLQKHDEVSLTTPVASHVLMGRKRTEENTSGYRFIGGFVDPGDPNLETTVRREVMEEADIDIGGVHYISSHKINDWRYRNTRDGVMTSLFVAAYRFGSIKPKDDIAELAWIPINEVVYSTLPIHQPLALSLEKFLAKERG